MIPSKLQIAKELINLSSDEEFDRMANSIMQYQRDSIPVLEQYWSLIDNQYAPIPIELFKMYRISSKEQTEVAFKSSGTTSNNRSTHHVADIDLYKSLSLSHFEKHFGKVSDQVVLALLPSYLENGDSSLVFMVNHFIETSMLAASSFVTLAECADSLKKLQKTNTPTVLFGVSFALLDLAEALKIDFPALTIIETGGMKGKRKEMTRVELHSQINGSFSQSKIESEYGMTELLSQAYTTDGVWFRPPNWMRISITDVSDPFKTLPVGSRGLLAITDLANIYSCSFIQTRDVGVLNEFGCFTVEGRLDNSDIRGCNLLHP